MEIAIKKCEEGSSSLPRDVDLYVMGHNSELVELEHRVRDYIQKLILI